MKKILVIASLVVSQMALATVFDCTTTKEIYSSEMKVEKVSFETKVIDGDEEIEMVTVARRAGALGPFEVANFQFELMVTTVTIPGTDGRPTSEKYAAKYVFKSLGNDVNKVNLVVKTLNLSNLKKFPASLFVMGEDGIENANDLACLKK